MPQLKTSAGVSLGELSATLRTHSAQSVLGQIQFAPGVMVPVGFLASHRKRNHLDCESGNGFQTTILPGGKRQVLCHCATERAMKKLKQVGGSAFAQLGGVWLVQTRSDLKKETSQAHLEGLRAKEGTANPYPKGSDLFSSWEEGYNAD